MPTYRTKPVEVQAFEWRGNDADLLMFLAANGGSLNTCKIEGQVLVVKTDFGDERAKFGDMLVVIDEGKFRVRDAQIFEREFELVR